MTELGEILARTAAGGPDGTCREWIGPRNHDGYGLVSRGGKTWRAHRLVAHLSGLALHKLHVLHRCDNPACCNPNHLFVGTNIDNIADKMAKGRHRVPHGNEQVGAKLNPEIVRDIRTKRIPSLHFSKLYGVSRRLVQFVQQRKSWAHVD